jgi:hypothetical protein
MRKPRHRVVKELARGHTVSARVHTLPYKKLT